MKTKFYVLALLFSTCSLAQAQDTLVIAGVGDVMLGTNYPEPKYLPPGGKNMMLGAAEDLSSPDITFANLEGTILTKGGDAKTCKDPSKCYVFRMPESYAGYLKECGIDMVSLANNHSGDMGSPGRKKTQSILDSLGIACAGHLNQPYSIVEKDSVKYGICAFSPNKGTHRITDYQNARKIIAELDTLCDIIIASFHGGAEGPDHRHLTKEVEYYYGENRGNVHEFAHMLVNAGADVVFGHGPHVVRALEVFNNRLICYSLGNFCTYARFNLTARRGYAPIVEAHIDSNGNFIEGRIVCYRQSGEGGPYLDTEMAALKEIQSLTEQDFPESGITFEEDGSFRLRKNQE